MNIPTTTYYYCPNGHGYAPSTSARFCNTCGSALVSAAYTNGYTDPNQAPMTVGPQPVPVCALCGGEGLGLADSVIVCPQCRWLRPLVPGYVVHTTAFQWAADSVAMNNLRSFTPLNAAARTVSDKVGRRWVETTFNAVRLGDNQLPHIYNMGIRAARLLGMPTMPDIYVAGDKMWECATYGSDKSAFLLIGTALLNNFKGDDLLFLLAREMGHCRAGHALWKTVGTLLLGQQGPRRGMMSEGLIGVLNPQHLISGALEVPLMAWARQSEITADRAALLAVGSEEVARRVLLSWSLRSVPLYQQINIEAWLQQQEDSDDEMTRMAEMITSPIPFITRRLKLLTAFAHSPELAHMRSIIEPLDTGRLVKPARQTAPVQPIGDPEPVPVGTVHHDGDNAPTDAVRITCPECGHAMRVPRAELAGKSTFKVRCPNSNCGKVLTMQRKSEAHNKPTTIDAASDADTDERNDHDE